MAGNGAARLETNGGCSYGATGRNSQRLRIVARRQQVASRTGHVYSDANGNALQGAGDADLSGLTVTLTDPFGVVRTTTTDATGNYTFTAVPAGTASVNVTDPAGNALTTANDPQNVSVTAGVSTAATPVGFQPRGTITGHVYSDVNGNALQGAGDVDLSGLTVTLTDPFGVTRTTTTDATGNYTSPPFPPEPTRSTSPIQPITA